jgi:hypothetical protein
MLLGLAGGLPATVAKAEDFAKSFAGATVKRLIVQQEAGAVVISAGEGAAVAVKGKKTHFDPGCELTAELNGTDLKVVNKAPESAPRAKCVVALRIELPKSAATVAYVLAVGAGDVALTKARGTLSFKVGAGDVAIADSDLSKIDGKSGSGNVVLGGSWDEADLKLGAGNAEVSNSKAPAKGALRLKWGTGHATVRLPKDSKVHSSFKAGMGSMTNEFAETAEPAFDVSAKAGAGDLTIRKL